MVETLQKKKFIFRSTYHKASKGQICIFLALKIEPLTGHNMNASRYGFLLF